MNEINETIDHLNTRRAEVKLLEEQALEHEQAARDCRAKRAEAKQQVAELMAAINDAKVVHAAQGSLAAARAAQQAAEKAAVEVAPLLASLAAKETELDELIKANAPEAE